MTDSTTPQDDAAMSPASDGSGSRLPSHLIQPEWMEAAKGMTFFAAPLDRLSRDELMAVIGYLSIQVKNEQRMHRSTLEILKERHTVSR
jgi:hypothetical protein